MTSRLIGLMSFVLLLCLGAVAFLLNQYQKQVMEEVAQTISTVGQETLRTLDTHGLHDIKSLATDAPLGYTLQTEFQFQAEHQPPESGTTIRHFRTAPGMKPGEFEGIVMFSRFDASGKECPTAEEEASDCDQWADRNLWAADESGGGEPVERKVVVGTGEGQLRERLFIRVEDIRTEGDATGMVLTIPAWIHQEGSWVAAVGADGSPAESVAWSAAQSAVHSPTWA